MSEPSNPPPSAQNQTPPKFHPIQAMINQQTAELSRALPKHMSAERLVRIALTCCRTTPKLLECTKESFLGALFTSAQIGIEPVAGRAYILPFKNSRKVDGQWYTTMDAQFILGYAGLIDLFYRHEKSLMLSWAEVRERDEFNYQFGTDAFLIHRPAQSGDRGQVTHYWVMATLAGNAKPFWVMSYDECIRHGMQHSKTYDRKAGKFSESSPWVTSEDAMCLKTVFKQLAKLLPLSIEVQRAIGADETSRTLIRGVQNVLDIPSATDWSLPENAEAAPEPMPQAEPQREKETVPAQRTKAAEKPRAATPPVTPPANHAGSDLAAAVVVIKDNAWKLGISDEVLDAALAKAAKSDIIPWRTHPAEILIGAAKTRGWNKIVAFCDEIARNRTAAPASAPASAEDTEPSADDLFGQP